VLIARRNRIAQAYLPAINPVIAPAIDESERLTFNNAAVEAAVAREPPDGYRASWCAYDNATGRRTPIGASARAVPDGTVAPGPLPTTPGMFVAVDIWAEDSAHPSWSEPVHAYFRRVPRGWILVGLERQK
jgi:hypothetical protein